MFDPNDMPPMEAGDPLDRTLRRVAAEKRSNLFYLGGTGGGALLAVIGAMVTVAGGPPWALFAGFGVGVVVGLVFAILGRKQLDYDPSGEIAPPLPSLGPEGADGGNADH